MAQSLSLNGDVDNRRETPEINPDVADLLSHNPPAFRAFIELFPEAVVVHQNGIIIQCNNLAADIFGMESSDHQIGRKIADFRHTDDIDDIRERGELVLAGEKNCPIVLGR